MDDEHRHADPELDARAVSEELLQRLKSGPARARRQIEQDAEQVAAFRLSGAEQRIVEVTTLDAFLATCRDEPVDLVKIDVEGDEHEVLVGAADVARRVRPVIVETEWRDPEK